MTEDKNRWGETGKKNDENSGHYVIASSRLPKRRLLEHCMLVPIVAPSCKLELARFSAQLKLKMKPNVSIYFLDFNYSGTFSTKILYIEAKVFFLSFSFKSFKNRKF